MNSFWGETIQLLTVFKVIYYVNSVASTFKNSFWGETVQLLNMYKVVLYILQAKASYQLRHLHHICRFVNLQCMIFSICELFFPCK
jgi:hypothetical protein